MASSINNTQNNPVFSNFQYEQTDRSNEVESDDPTNLADPQSDEENEIVEFDIRIGNPSEISPLSTDFFTTAYTTTTTTTTTQDREPVQTQLSNIPVQQEEDSRINRLNQIRAAYQTDAVLFSYQNSSFTHQNLMREALDILQDFEEGDPVRVNFWLNVALDCLRFLRLSRSEWCFFMSIKPDLQIRMQAEIRRAFGDDKVQNVPDSIL